jgi:hypothetical protein
MNEDLDYLTYDPAEQPGADEVPDFDEEFKEALAEYYREEDQYQPFPCNMPVVPMKTLEQDKNEVEDRLINSFWNHEDRIGC